MNLELLGNKDIPTHSPFTAWVEENKEIYMAQNPEAFSDYQYLVTVFNERVAMKTLWKPRIPLVLPIINLQTGYAESTLNLDPNQIVLVRKLDLIITVPNNPPTQFPLAPAPAAPNKTNKPVLSIGISYMDLLVDGDIYPWSICNNYFYEPTGNKATNYVLTNLNSYFKYGKMSFYENFIKVLSLNPEDEEEDAYL